LAGSAAGSANKVITGVVDSSWTALRGLIIAQPAGTDGVEAGETAQAVASAPALRQRHPSSFSLASVTASVASIAAAAAASTTAARNRNRADSHASAMVPEHQWGGNQEMMEVASRPESIRETGEDHAIHSKESENTDEESSDREEEHQRRVSDARSIRRVSSMLDHEANRARDEAMERVSLNDRLASIGVLGKTGTAESAGPITSPEVVPSKVSFGPLWKRRR